MSSFKIRFLNLNGKNAMLAAKLLTYFLKIVIKWDESFIPKMRIYAMELKNWVKRSEIGNYSARNHWLCGWNADVRSPVCGQSSQWPIHGLFPLFILETIVVTQSCRSYLITMHLFARIQKSVFLNLILISLLYTLYVRIL